MKKFYIATSFFLLIGIVMTIYGLANNGAKTIIVNNDGNASIFHENKIDEEFAVDKIDELNIQVTNANVSIERGDKFKISQVGNNTDKIKVENNNGKVTLKDGANIQTLDYRNRFGQIGLNAIWSDNQIKIEVPTDKKIKIVNSTSNYGLLSITDDVIDTLNIEKTSPQDLVLQDVKLSDKSNIKFANFYNEEYSNASITIQNSTIQGKWNFEHSDLLSMEVMNSVVKNVIIDLQMADGLTFKDSTLESSKITGAANLFFSRMKFVGENTVNFDEEVVDDDETLNQLHLTDIHGVGIKVNNPDMKINLNDHDEPKRHSYEINPKNKNRLNVIGESGQVFLRNVD